MYRTVQQDHRMKLLVVSVLAVLAVRAQAQTPVSVAQVANQQFLNASGTPLASGCVFTYAAGTTTLQATYTDSTGTTQNTNPVILNAGGFASIWVAGQAYKFKVVSSGGTNCATGTTQWTVDGINSYADGLGGNNAWLGNESHAGSESFSGNVTATAGQNQFSAYTLNNIRLVDGVKYPYTNTGIQNCITDAQSSGSAAICDARGIPTGTSVTISTSLTDNSKAVVFLAPLNATFTSSTVAVFNFLAAGSKLSGPACDIWAPPDALSQNACFTAKFQGNNTSAIVLGSTTSTNTSQTVENVTIDVTGSGSNGHFLFSYGGQFNYFHNLFLKGGGGTKILCFSLRNGSTPTCPNSGSGGGGGQTPTFENIMDDNTSPGNGAILRIEGTSASAKVMGPILKNIHTRGGGSTQGSGGLQLAYVNVATIQSYFNDGLTSTQTRCISFTSVTGAFFDGVDCEGTGGTSDVFFDFDANTSNLSAINVNRLGCSLCKLWSGTAPSQGFIEVNSGDSIRFGNLVLANAPVNGLYAHDPTGANNRELAAETSFDTTDFGDGAVAARFNSTEVYPTTDGGPDLGNNTHRWFNAWVQHVQAITDIVVGTQKAGGANALTSVSGAKCVNVTPATNNTNTTSDQNEMTCLFAANDLNFLLRHIHVRAKGVFTTAGTYTVNIKLKACSVGGCATGTALNLVNITAGATAAAVTNNPWTFDADVTTQTAGASGVFEASGELKIDLSSANTAAASVYPDTNTATIGTIDQTGPIYFQLTFAFGTASGANSVTQRQMVDAIVY
jgi:hypothetical protein